MRFFGKTLLWASAVIALLAVYPLFLFGFLNFKQSGQDIKLSHNEISASLDVFSACLLFVTAVIAIRFCWQMVCAFLPTAGPDMLMKRRALIAFAGAALFFPSVFGSLVTGLLSALDTLLSGLAALAFDRVGSTQSTDVQSTTGGLAEAVGPFSRLLNGYATQLVQAIRSFTRSISFGTLVFPYAVWLIIFFSMGSSRNDLPEASQINRFVNWFRRLAPKARYYCLVSIVFLVGCYLSIAAMISIPSLQPQVADNSITKERLQASLQAATLAKDEFDKRFLPDFAKSPPSLGRTLTNLLTLKTFLNESTNFSAEALIKTRQFLSQREMALQDAQARRADYSIQWINLRSDASDLEQSLLKQAVSSFDIDNLTPMVTQERLLYFQNVVSWYRSSVEDSRNTLGEAMRVIERTDRDLEEFTSFLTEDTKRNTDLLLKGPVEKSLPYTFDPILRDSWVLTRVSSSVPRLPSLYRTSREDPQPPEPGFYAGPFAYIARWLLRTRSFSLTLITGMIGFGLLGSSIASFVRTDIPMLQENTPAMEAGKAVIQGLSTAILTFLAAQGGLAITTKGERDPNGYVVCFACLVGAVFSEHVWAWAKGKLIEKMPLMREKVLEKAKRQKDSLQSGSEASEPCDGIDAQASIAKKDKPNPSDTEGDTPSA